MIKQIYGLPKDASWDGFMERFQILFQDRNKSMKVTCMCWGIECPIGWYYILEQLCTILEFHNLEFKEKYGIAIVADQVKEKYGTLRFYFSIRNVDKDGLTIPFDKEQEEAAARVENEHRIAVDYLDMLASKYIQEAEAHTEKTCADCGGHDDIIVTKGWITYICKKCNAKREKEYEKRLEELRKKDAKPADVDSKV